MSIKNNFDELVTDVETTTSALFSGAVRGLARLLVIVVLSVVLAVVASLTKSWLVGIFGFVVECVIYRVLFGRPD